MADDKENESSLINVEDLIHLAMGPQNKNVVQFKTLEKVLYILAKHMRVLDQKVEIPMDELNAAEVNPWQRYGQGATPGGLALGPDGKPITGKSGAAPGLEGWSASTLDRFTETAGVVPFTAQNISMFVSENFEVVGDPRSQQSSVAERSGSKQKTAPPGASGQTSKYEMKATKYEHHGHSRRGSEGRNEGAQSVSVTGDEGHRGRVQRTESVAVPRQKYETWPPGGGQESQDDSKGRKSKGQGRGGFDYAQSVTGDDGRRGQRTESVSVARRTSETGQPVRVGSVEVVTQQQFAQLEATVDSLMEKTDLPLAPTLPDNKTIVEDILSRRASLSDTVSALQLSHRIHAAEEAIGNLADMLTHMLTGDEDEGQGQAASGLQLFDPRNMALGPDGKPITGPGGVAIGLDGKPITGPGGIAIGIDGKPITGPGGIALGPDGKPLVGPNGIALGPNGKPLYGPDGIPIGPDGKPLTQLEGLSLGPDGKPITGPGGVALGIDGKPITGPGGVALGPDGKPLVGPDGIALGPDGKPLYGPDGIPIGPDGKPITGPREVAVSPDGRPITGSGGVAIGVDGKPITGPGGVILGPDGKPLVGPNGIALGPDGKPLYGPDGIPIGPDGKPLAQLEGLSLGPDGKPITGPGGVAIGIDGKPITGPGGVALGPDGKPLVGPDGIALGPDGKPLYGPDGIPIGPDGNPITQVRELALGPDGKPITGPGGVAIGSDGKPITGPGGVAIGIDGKPICGPGGVALGPDGKPLVGPGGVALGPDGKPLYGPDGIPIGPDGKPLAQLEGLSLGPDGKPITGPGGVAIGIDGKPITGPGGVALGPDGKPLVGPGGIALGPDGKPLYGPDGIPIGPDGKPITGSGEVAIGPDGKPITGPGGVAIGVDGKPITGPGGVALGPDGKPLVGPDGIALGPDGKPLFGPDGIPIGPDGKPITQLQGLALGPDGKPLTGPGGVAIGIDGKPITGPGGVALGPDGKPLSGPGGVAIGPDGKPLTGPGGVAIGIDGKPITGPGGVALGPDGKPLVGPGGVAIGPDGKPITGPNGFALGPDGKPLIGPGGVAIGPDGKPVTGPGGVAIGINGKPITGPGGVALGPDGKPLVGQDGIALGPDGKPLIGSDGTPRGPDGKPIIVVHCVTKAEMEEEMNRLRTELLRHMQTALQVAAASADTISTRINVISEQIEKAFGLDDRVLYLQSLVNSYASELEGYDTGITTQLQSFQDQMKVLRAEMANGLAQLEEVNSNAETAAVMELTEKYNSLVSELEDRLYAHQELGINQNHLADELRALVEAVELMREEKADRDEVLDGLRDKADLSRLSGLLSERDFEAARDDLQVRIQMCYDKFRRQDSMWMNVVTDFNEIAETKAELMSLISMREEIQNELQDLHRKVQYLAKELGDPKAAVVARKLSKGATCASCRVPALIEPFEPLEPAALPAMPSSRHRPEPAGAEAKEAPEQPCLRTVVLRFGDEGEPEKGEPHLCRRWVGGSHTLIGSRVGCGAVAREHASNAVTAAPVKQFDGFGSDGKMYHMEEKMSPCVECNEYLGKRGVRDKGSKNELPGGVSGTGAGDVAFDASRRRVTLVDPTLARRVTVLDDQTLRTITAGPEINSNERPERRKSTPGGKDGEEDMSSIAERSDLQEKRLSRALIVAEQEAALHSMSVGETVHGHVVVLTNAEEEAALTDARKLVETARSELGVGAAEDRGDMAAD